MMEKGILSGYPDGTFKPENNMKKSEFYKVINGLMGFENKDQVKFDDVKSTDWYYGEIEKAVAANYLLDTKSLNPKDNITREEVARIIGLAFGVEEDEKAAAEFLDAKDLPKSLKGIIGGLKKKGFIAGYPDGSFRPKSEIKRSEVVKMLYNISGQIVNKEGTLKKDIKTNLVVNRAGVVLKDMIIEGDLYLTEGIGEGDVSLDNVEVKGELNIKGGGENSIKIKNSKINKVSIDKQKGLVRVVFENSTVEEVKTAKEVKLELTDGTKIKIVELDGKVDVLVEKGTVIVSIDAVSKEVVMQSQGTIESIKTTADVKVNGETVKANTETKVKDGKKTDTTPKKPDTNTSSNNTGESNGSSGGSSSGGSSRPSTVLVSGVSIIGGAMVGSTLIAETIPERATVDYQWEISTDGTIYTDIDGAISNIYIPLAEDSGKFIRLAVIGKGSYRGRVTSIAREIISMSAYRVEHYQQNVTGAEYTLVDLDTDNLRGRTGAQTAAEAKTYPGFTAGVVTQETIAADGSTVIKIYYDREKYTVKFVDEDGTSVLAEQTVAYGVVPEYTGTSPTKAATAEFTYTFAGWAPEIVSVTGDATYTATYTSTTNKYTVKFVDEDGTSVLTEQTVAYGARPEYTGTSPTKAATAEFTYTFAGWTPEIVSVTGEATYTATYTSVRNVEYKVEHYKYEESAYKLVETETLRGTTGSTTEAKSKTYDDFVAQKFNQTTINEDGSTVVEIKYDKIVNNPLIAGLSVPLEGETPVTTITEGNQYTGSVSWSPADNPFKTDVEYTASVMLTAKEGYSFEGVKKNFFVVEGARLVTNEASSSSVVVVFPNTNVLEMTGTVSITGATKFASILTADISALTNAGTPTYAWYRGESLIPDANENTYSLSQADIGQTIKLAVSADGISGRGTITSSPTDTIKKADGPAAPEGLGKTDITSIGGSDGTLTGTSVGQEYRKDGLDSWTAITGDRVTNLGLGSYLVRFKETDTHYPGIESDPIVIAISHGGKVDHALSEILKGVYEIPYVNQTNQASKTTWVQEQVNVVLNGIESSIQATSASVTFADSTYTVRVKSGDVERSEILSVTQAPQPIGGSISITGELKFGQTLIASISGGNFEGLGETTYTWKRDGNEISSTNLNTYTLVEGDIGKGIYVEVSNSERAGILTSQATSVIEKAKGPVPPEGIGAEKSDGFDEYGIEISNTGKLIGVVLGQEYRSQEDDTWTAISENGTIGGLAHGKYLVRVAETATHKAGQPTEPITIDLTDGGKIYTDLKNIDRISHIYIPMEIQSEERKSAHVKAAIEAEVVLEYSNIISLVLYQTNVAGGTGESYRSNLKLKDNPSHIYYYDITAYLLGSYSSLEYRINQVVSVYEDAVEGTDVGQVASGSKATLLIAIETAEAVLASFEETTVGLQALVDAQEALDYALESFEAGRVK